jgi:hypothetical protein
MALITCCLMALSRLLDVVYSSNPGWWVSFLYFHCWGSRLPGRGGSGPGFGGVVNGVADTVRYVVGGMIWPRCPLMPP